MTESILSSNQSTGMKVLEISAINRPTSNFNYSSHSYRSASSELERPYRVSPPLPPRPLKPFPPIQEEKEEELFMNPAYQMNPNPQAIYKKYTRNY